MGQREQSSGRFAALLSPRLRCGRLYLRRTPQHLCDKLVPLGHFGQLWHWRIAYTGHLSPGYRGVSIEELGTGKPVRLFRAST